MSEKKRKNSLIKFLFGRTKTFWKVRRFRARLKIVNVARKLDWIFNFEIKYRILVSISPSVAIEKLIYRYYYCRCFNLRYEFSEVSYKAKELFRRSYEQYRITSCVRSHGKFLTWKLFLIKICGIQYNVKRSFNC